MAAKAISLLFVISTLVPRPLAHEVALGRPAAPVRAGKGELAVVSSGSLVLHQRDGSTRALLGPGRPSGPSWSPDGRWVAYLQTASDKTGKEQLWVARYNGSDAHRLSPASGTVGNFAWSPGAGEMLAFSFEGPSSLATTVMLGSPRSTRARALAKLPELVGFEWAPSGKSIAVSFRQGQPTRGEGFVDIYSLSGRARRVVAKFPHFGYALLAGWWGRGRGLLYWDDAAGSASIAADGLPLDSVDLSTGKVTALATTLTYQNWVAVSPDGREVAVVAGGLRVVWGDGKRVELCHLPAGRCRPAGSASRHEMSLDPVFTEAGRLVFDVAPASTSGSWGRVPGVKMAGTAAFSARNVMAWYATQRLFISTSEGAKPVRGAQSGAHDPLPTSDGLLYVRAKALWYLNLANGRDEPVEVASGLAGGGNYYGYVPWYQDFAWHR